MERGLHGDFKQEKKYYMENGIIDENWEEHNFDEEKMSSIINSIKHCVISYINLCKADWTTYKGMKKKIKIAIKKLEKMENLPS